MAASISLLLSPPSPLSLSSNAKAVIFPAKIGGGAHRTSLPRLAAAASSGAHFSTTTAAAKSYGGPTYRKKLDLSSCHVIPPPVGRKPRAVVKFLGGAFIGAVPEITYSYLIELLAKEGYLVILVPYNVTFDHAAAAKEVYDRFHLCMEELSTSGLPDANISASDVANLPLYCVGHSNGALLQLLVGSYYSEKLPKANVVIAFNNRPASEAVPYFEQIGPLVSQVTPIIEANPLVSLARNASGDALKTLLNTAQTFVRDDNKETLTSLTKFVDQLPSVLNQVTQGTSEFKPTPLENRELFKISYNVPHTLLVKFITDAIDETDTVEEILRPRVESTGGTLEKVTLPGNHITPCAQDLRWDVGEQYTPADAIAQGVKSLALGETRTLARTVIDYLGGVDR